MGKNSLIKSTDKKKGKAKTEEKETKKKVVKKAAKESPKTTKSKPEPAGEKIAPVAPSAKPAQKKVTVKELILKKFEPLKKESKMPAPEKKPDLPEAPPFISAKDPKEAARIRKLLSAKFSMQEINAAAKAPEEPVPGKKVKAIPKKAPAPKPAAEPKVAQPVKETTPEVRPVVSTMGAEPSNSGSDPVQKAMKMAIAGFALLVLLIIGASYKNSGKYYIEPKADAIEILQGKFSPTGKEFLLVLHGQKAPDDVQTVYTREEVFPLIFNYYLDKADALLDTAGLPDYEGIKTYLNKAKDFVANAEMGDAVATRLNNIDRMTLLYKADVAISKATEGSLEAAVDYLKQAERLTDDTAQLELIARRTALVKERQAAFTGKAGEEEKPAAE